MRTLDDAEAWAREHSATLKINYAEGIACMQVSGFVAYWNKGGPIEETLSELIERIEQQMSERLTQPGTIATDHARLSR